MDISITAVTANKQLDKAFPRLVMPLNKLRECCKGIVTESEPFDILQIVFEDQPETFVESHKMRKASRLLQISVGLPSSLSFKPADDDLLLSEMEKQILKAVEQSNLSEAKKKEAIQQIEAVKMNTD